MKGQATAFRPNTHEKIHHTSIHTLATPGPDNLQHEQSSRKASRCVKILPAPQKQKILRRRPAALLKLPWP
eukprot:scaffold5892_cov169-Pinguiococcus_pyrenoidosus.AAC.1